MKPGASAPGRRPPHPRSPVGTQAACRSRRGIIGAMFDGLDLSVLESPEFKEDAVREEIIAPFLKRLGYRPSGRSRVQRSKSLTHPFVRIGTRKHSVTIIPDYTLYHDEKPILILDAKSPSEQILHSHHVEQAYSYAIHPEIRCRHFALCNGRQLVLFDVDEFEPVLVVEAKDFEARWHEIAKHFSPESLINPILRSFQPDLGLAVMRLGMAPETEHFFVGCSLQLIARVSDDLYTANTTFDLGESPHLASFDFSPDLLDPILSCFTEPLATMTRKALSQSPFQVQADCMIEVDWATYLGDLTRGQDDAFVPFVVKQVLGSRFDSSLPLKEGDDVPEHVFRLSRAVELLRRTKGAGTV